MYITTIYSKLNNSQKKNISKFISRNFNTNKIEIEPMTIIILYIENKNILGCVCILDNKFLVEKLKLNNIPLKYYNINNSHGCFLYNLCVDINHRNKKIGYGLINYAVEKMSRIKIDYLHTHSENEVSQILFLKNGFMEDFNFKSPDNSEIQSMSKFL
jgi:ribosomal protein S18 acetylase RimI-like enzyme